VVAGMGKAVESDRPSQVAARRALDVRMLGRLTICRDGVELTLPASRKVRALIAYLVLAPHAVARSHLCELLWDVPNDPRGELRWSLSKIRSIVDEPGRRRVDTRGDAITVDLTDCFVDAVEIVRAAQERIETLEPERLRALSMLFNGDFLDGLEIDRSPVFSAWLTAQRRRFRGCHAAVLERLVSSIPDDDQVFGYLEKWLQIAPFDQRVHSLLLNSLARHGLLREGEEHLAATARLFESEGLDCAAIRDVWRAAKRQEDLLPVAAAAAPTLVPATPHRASIAVMPFVDQITARGTRGGSGDGLAHDVITRLAKLRSLFVIAQGTVFALDERCIGPEEAGRMLNVDYTVHGALRRQGKRVTVTVELTETRTARIVWAEVFNHPLNDAFLVLDEIGNRIVASIASEIEMTERNRAILRPPNSLNAWEAYHRGLWHMYRFSRAENDWAKHFFETAVRLDPTFSRAYAGLSFTHFQNAFQGWANREPEIERAFEAAGQSLLVDDHDPAAHWAMGRALWLRGRHDQSVVELEQAIELSPNFALGHYTLAFVHSQTGDARAAVAFSDHARQLSPFDPLLFAMLGARAMALVRLGQFEQAADWGVKAAARPNAHAHILAIAAYCLALADRRDEARAYLASIRKTLPHYRVDEFLTAMQFEPEGTALFREAANRIGAD
jgi:DNA-binding SARP family transcriptional activator/Flp pilus assembly protein TadD